MIVSSGFFADYFSYTIHHTLLIVLHLILWSVTLVNPHVLMGQLRTVLFSSFVKIQSAAQLTTYLLKRGYNRNFVTKQILRSADIHRNLSLQTKEVNKPKLVPLITTFNPALPHISNIIKKHYNLLRSSDRCKNVLQHLPVEAFSDAPPIFVTY